MAEKTSQSFIINSFPESRANLNKDIEIENSKFCQKN